MEKHIENFLNKVSLVFITIATITLLYLYLHTPETCIPPNTPITKPHLKFPSSTCDPSLNRPYIDPDKKRLKLWSSKSWLSQVSSFTTFFQSSNILNNKTKVLCVSAGAGHEVMALKNMGVSDVTGVEIVDSLPLVKRADPNNLPFFDGVFDLAFKECGGEEVDAIAGLFRKSMFVGAENVTLIGMRMTRIIMRVGVSSSL
ncbi:hypothetical protein OIU85_004184 [Salix viminalis]|uniref:Methyltransferase type 11 domain-containing protein n=1 Tax=Salix viminalis TaxID=40686 RepID=A0A9Q0PSW4_SALVM|nr:hypothetical protein OIU85_004184 [Salix viminalis]